MSKNRLPQSRPQKGVMLEPGKGHVADWVNRYSLSLFPFKAQLTASRELPANPMRTYLLIQNKSAGTIYVNFGQNPTVFSGIEIASGGNYIMEGGAPSGAFVSPDDVYVLGSAADLDGVIAEGLWQSVSI